jgi:hypothetical protein
MKFIHGADWRCTRVGKRDLVDSHMYIAARHVSNEQESEAQIRALSEIVSALLVRLPDEDVRAVAEAVGFQVVDEEGK